MIRTKRFWAALLVSLGINALLIALLGVSAPLPAPPPPVTQLRPMPIAPEPAPPKKPTPTQPKAADRKYGRGPLAPNSGGTGERNSALAPPELGAGGRSSPPKLGARGRSAPPELGAGGRFEKGSKPPVEAAGRSQARAGAVAPARTAPGHQAGGTQAGPANQGKILDVPDLAAESRPVINPGDDTNHWNGHVPVLPQEALVTPYATPGAKPAPQALTAQAPVPSPPLPWIGATSRRGTVPIRAGLPLPAKPPEFLGDGTGLLGSYYFGVNFNRLAFRRADRNIDFEWSGTSPDPVRLPVGNAFTVQWHGGLVPRFSEPCTLYTASDDGARVWIDGRLVIDDWSIHAGAEDAATLPLEAGRVYDLRVQYFEKNGLSGEIIKLYWQSAHQPREFIPQSQLRFPP